MKQGTVITKVIMSVFLAAVLAYLGYSVFSAVYDPLTTTTAVACTAGESCSVKLWLVREEMPVFSDAYITDLTLPDGAKVAAGGEVARGYRTEESYNRQQELEEKQERLAQLEYTYQEGQQIHLDAKTVADLDKRIDDGLVALGRSSADNDLLAVSDQIISLRTLVLRRSSSEVDQSLLESNIETLHQEISLLSDQIAVNANTVTVDQTGWFAGVCDGYEMMLTPVLLDQAGVQEFQAATSKSPDTFEHAVGRLVTSPIWYAAALIPEEYAGRFDHLSSVQLDLDRSLTELIPMDVESVSAPFDGQRLVVFSCDEYLQDVIHLRTAEAGIVLHLYDGIRVPKQAIHVGKDGGAGVYVIQGANAVFKSVHILYDNGDTFVVEEDRSSTNHLWVGDEIIVAARNLYDGKVVK